MSVATNVRWGDQKISHNCINLKDPIKRIVVLLLGHQSLSIQEIREIYFFSQIGRTAFMDTLS